MTGSVIMCTRIPIIPVLIHFPLKRGQPLCKFKDTTPYPKGSIFGVYITSEEKATSFVKGALLPIVHYSEALGLYEEIVLSSEGNV